MTMSCWQILGLDETFDKRQIKKAYARQLKQIDQEQNPDAFIALRQALEDAIAYAEYYQNNDDTQSEIAHNTHDTETANSTYRESSIEYLNENLQPIQQDGLHIDVIHTIDTDAIFTEHSINNETASTSTSELTQAEYQFVQSDLIERLQHSNLIFDGQEGEQHYYIYYHHHQPLIFQLLNHSLYYLDTEQFDDESFAYFQEVIHFIQQQQILEQIDLKNCFSAYLSAVQSAKSQPNFARFVLLWHTHFPDPEQYFIDSQNERLYDYIDYFQKQQEFLNGLDDKIKIHLNKLIYNQRFSLWSMLRLFFHRNLMQNLQYLNIVDIASNKNYFFLHNLNQWHKELWILIICYLSSWLLLNHLDSELNLATHFLTPRNIALIALAVLVIYYIAQFIIKCKILTSEEQQSIKIQNYLKYIWFFTGILSCFAFSFVAQWHTPVALTMSYSWLIFTCFIFSLAQYQQDIPLYKQLFKSVNIYIDFLAIGLSVFIVLLYAFTPYMYYDIKTPQWLYVYSFIPIGFLFFGEYFTSLYRQLSYSKQYYLFKRYHIKSNLKYFLQDQTMIIARAGLLFAPTYMMTNIHSLANFYTGILLFLSILMIAHRDYLSYLLKYLTFILYFIIVLVLSNFSSSIAGTIVFVFLFSMTLYHDFKKFRTS